MIQTILLCLLSTCRNTTHSILSLVDYLINSFQSNKLTCAIFLDFCLILSIAFEPCPEFSGQAGCECPVTVAPKGELCSTLSVACELHPRFIGQSGCECPLTTVPNGELCSTLSIAHELRPTISGQAGSGCPVTAAPKGVQYEHVNSVQL